MSGGVTRDDDPFAGYTPVRPAIPVVDAEVPDLPQGRRYRSRKRKESGGLVRTAKLVLLGIVSLALIGVIAAVAGGFFHERSVGEMVPELTDYSDCAKPLTDMGRSIRAKIRDLPIVRTIPWGREQESRPVSPIPAATSNVLLQASRMKAAQRVADGDSFAFDASEEGSPTVAVQESERPQPGKRMVDPELKRFKAGGRKGRTLR